MCSRLLALLLVCLLAACAADADAGGAGGTGGSGGSAEPVFPLRFGGPLASAGADQRVLPGMPVRLDGRASLAGEEGLPIAFLWTQEAGPRVSLDDPTGAEPGFVAPPLRSAATRLVFRLTVDDGDRRSRDRVVVELVDTAGGLSAAPVAVGGEDLAVRPGATVDLGTPSTLDAGCLDQGGAAGCEARPLAFRWTQVDGAPVVLDGATFSAPPFDALLTFRLDATRAGDPAACGADGPDDADTLCSAPDYVRVLVNGSARVLDRAPAAPLAGPPAIPPTGGLLRFSGTADGSYSPSIAVQGTTEDAVPDLYTFRPLLGGPRGANGRPAQVLPLEHAVFLPDGRELGSWPRAVAVAYETQAGRLASRPTPAVVRWEPPAGTHVPVARAGDDPCAQPLCRPFLGGATVTLDASGSFDPDGTALTDLTFCWLQTLGPPVTFAEGSSACIRGEPVRTFVAPEAPAGGTALQLAFVLTVRDDGPLASLPDTAMVQIRPVDNEPPDVVVVSPAQVDEGATVRLDASRSTDPEGGALTYFWRPVDWPEGVPPVALDDAPPCLVAGAPGAACSSFVAPSVTRDTVLQFEVSVTDSRLLSATRRVQVLVRNSNNDPPVVDAGPDRVVKPGAAVELTGIAHDPNPGEDDTLVYTWRVLEGGVTLESGEGPVARFTAPSAAVDRDLVLALTVTDVGGASTSDRVTVSVLANGPYLSTSGDDAHHGSAAAPVATLARALAIAGDGGFARIHLGGGTFVAGAAQVEGVELRGGHDEAAGWRWPADTETRLVFAEGLVLGAGGGLERLAVTAVAGGATELVRVAGDASVRDARVNAAALTAAGAVAVRVDAGTFAASASQITGPAGAPDGGGISCAAGAAIDLQDADVDGGSGPGDHVAVSLAAGCGGQIAGSTLLGGTADDEAVGLVARGGAPLVVENSVLRGGSGGTTIGARVRGATIRGSELHGGSGTERIGLEVPSGASCGAPPCVTVEGGSVRGGAGAGGTAVGVRALAPVSIAGALRIVGAEGDAQTATGVQLLAGGTLRDVAELRAIEGGVAGTATGMIAAGTASLVNAGDWAGGLSSGDAVGIEVRGALVIDGAAFVGGSEGGANTATAIRVLAGGSLDADGLRRVEGGPAATSSRGVDTSGELALTNAVVLAGPAAAAEAVRAAGPAQVHSSLLLVRDGGARTSALLLAAGGGVALRNTVLVPGNAADRAHVRDAGGGLPQILSRVLFAVDPACGLGGAYVRTVTGAAACSSAGIRALGAGWDPLVGDPLFLDAAGGDYRPAQASPAVDAGTSDLAPAVDVLGAARGGDGNGDGTPGFDIGPFER